MKQKLDRTLGLFSSLTISIGTMIGSAIFVLAGISFETAGASASLSVFLSGIAALFTAFSFAELVTIIPTAGGGYAYVREATNNSIFGFICGWGFWLGYAMSCGLFALGFGNFLNYFFPFIPQLVGSYVLIIYVIFTNIKGMRNTGKLQDIITAGLIVLLLGYIIYGSFFVDINNQVPYLNKGLSGTFKAMGFLYMTYIGYGLITTASEEVIDPEKTIPKAIIISVVVVIFIKTATFFIGSSIIHWSNLSSSVTTTPMIDTAIKIGGRFGGYLFALAGILATLSSINTAVMASSRTSFALSRDKKFPMFFKVINSKTKTPIFSILITGLIVFITTAIRDLENISTVTSIFSLVGYSLVNVALIIFRKKMPEKERKFKAPLYPITPILGIFINIFMAIQLMMSDLKALIIALFIIVLGILYYYIGIPMLNKASKGITPQAVPGFKLNSTQDYSKGYNILIPIANPQSVEPLIQMGSIIAKAFNGSITPIHVMDVPEVITMDSKYSELKSNMGNYDEILEKIESYKDDKEIKREPLLILSRDVGHAVSQTAKDSNSNLVLSGWHRTALAKYMLKGAVPKILKQVKTSVVIYKEGKSLDIKKILFPYGGGFHSQAALPLVKKIAQIQNAEITILRITEESTVEKEYEEMNEILLDGLKKLDVKGNIKIIPHHHIEEGILEESINYDLVVLGASSEWGLSNYVTGFTTDKIMEKIKCNGLIIREFNSTFNKTRFRNLFNKVKNLSK